MNQSERLALTANRETLKNLATNRLNLLNELTDKERDEITGDALIAAGKELKAIDKFMSTLHKRTEALAAKEKAEAAKK